MRQNGNIKVKLEDQKKQIANFTELQIVTLLDAEQQIKRENRDKDLEIER